ncbi:MAG: pilus assembly protein [Chloroflexota bacterium]|nr:pilus assembly protein [Chloroflexota bacterium]
MGIQSALSALSWRSGVMRRLTAGARRSTPGQAIIEFCLVLPVILLIALATVDAGRFVFDYIGLRNAAMEGAIYGSLHPTDLAGAEQRVRQHFLPNPVPAGLTVSRNADGSCSGTGSVGQNGFITVAVSREFSPLSLAALQYLGPGADWEFTVQSTAKARCMT